MELYKGGFSMLDGVFSRGTTPTQIFPLPGDLKMSEFYDIVITYRQKGKVVLTKNKSDCRNIPELNGEKNAIVVLSQADTLLFNPNIKLVEVQVKGASTGNDVFMLGEYRLRLEDDFSNHEFDFTKYE
jgi:hypothetical protein